MPFVVPPESRAILSGNVNRPGAALTARARHRRTDLPCTVHFPIWADPMRDRRHEAAAAWPDLADWLVELDLENKRPLTIYQYERHVAPLFNSHPGKTFREFTAQDVKDELHARPARSRHSVRAVFSSLFQWGVRDGRLDRNPMDQVRKIKAPRPRPADIFTEAERAALEALPTPDGELWTVLFGTGLRRGDARRLQRRHVDLDRGRIMIVSGKGDKDALIPYWPEVGAAVAELDLFERLEPDDHLWYLARYQVGDKRRRRDPIGDSTFDRWYRNGIEAAGVRYLTPHRTRHTYGWWLKTEKGFPIEERKFMMRHENIATTERFYDRTSIQDVEARIRQEQALESV